MPAQRRYQRKSVAAVRSRQGSQTGTASAVLGKPGAACELTSGQQRDQPERARNRAETRETPANGSIFGQDGGRQHSGPRRNTLFRCSCDLLLEYGSAI